MLFKRGCTVAIVGLLADGNTLVARTKGLKKLFKCETIDDAVTSTYLVFFSSEPLLIHNCKEWAKQVLLNIRCHRNNCIFII